MAVPAPDLRPINGLRTAKAATSSKSRQNVAMPTSLTFGALFELLEPPSEELRLARVLDVAARQHAAEEDAGGLELVHVLEDEHFHLPRPERHVRRARIAVDGRGVAAGERQVLQPVFGDQRGVRERRP